MYLPHDFFFVCDVLDTHFILLTLNGFCESVIFDTNDDTIAADIASNNADVIFDVLLDVLQIVLYCKCFGFCAAASCLKFVTRDRVCRGENLSQL